MIRRLLLLGLAALLLHAAWDHWRLRPLHPPAGVLAAAEPLQTALTPDDDLHSAAAPPSRLGAAALQPVARYEIAARLLSRQRYRIGRAAALAPFDFALGWGAMSDSAVLNRLTIGQQNRYFWLLWDTPPLPPEQMMRHAANVHLIPRDGRVLAALDTMRPGQVVVLRGWLVDARSADGWSWFTSRTRDDVGDGSCELMWVDEATTKAR